MATRLQWLVAHASCLEAWLRSVELQIYVKYQTYLSKKSRFLPFTVYLELLQIVVSGFSLERCTRITVIASGSSMCVSITMVLTTQSPCFTIMSLLWCCSTCITSTSTVTSTEYWNFHLYWLCSLWWAERQRDWHYQRGVCAEYGLNSLLGSCRGYRYRSRGQVSFV